MILNNAIKGKVKIINNGSLIRKCKIISNCKNNTIVFPKNGYFEKCIFRLNGNNNKIIFGEGARAIKGDFFIEDNNGIIETGKGTKYSGTIHLACTEGGKIVVGENCLFSSDIVVRNGDSHSILDSSGVRINKALDVIIGNHVWVCNRVIITKGVFIGDNNVIGTGSVVTKRFLDSNSIIAGCPAKIVKKDVNWNESRL